MSIQFDLNNIRKKNILVIGDLMLDIYLSGIASRISPEAPVPVVTAKQKQKVPGGAANVISNLVSLGCNVMPMGLIGSDYEGEYLLSVLQNMGVNTECIIKCPGNTINKTRILANGQHIVRYDFDADFNLYSKEKSELIEWIGTLKDSKIFDAIVISDYCKGTVCNEVMESVKRFFNCPIIGDTKTIHKDIFSELFCITPNLMEARRMIGFSNSMSPTIIAKTLKGEMKLESIIITMSDKGILLIDKNDQDFVFGAYTKLNEHDPSQRFDVTGAGDTVISVFSACVAAGFSLAFSVHAANVAAGIVVNKIGTSSCTYNELQNELAKNDRATASAQ